MEIAIREKISLQALIIASSKSLIIISGWQFSIPYSAAVDTIARKTDAYCWVSFEDNSAYANGNATTSLSPLSDALESDPNTVNTCVKM